jgi:hypothetical protein
MLAMPAMTFLAWFLPAAGAMRADPHAPPLLKKPDCADC